MPFAARFVSNNFAVLVHPSEISLDLFIQFAIAVVKTNLIFEPSINVSEIISFSTFSNFILFLKLCGCQLGVRFSASSSTLFFVRCLTTFGE